MAATKAKVESPRKSVPQPTPPIHLASAHKFEEGEAKNFLLLGGSYTNKDGQTWKFVKGKDIVVTDTLPLDEMFANSFRRLSGPDREYVPPGDAVDVSADTDTEEPAEGEKAEATSEEAHPLGEDVTDQFPAAQLAKYRVYKDGKHYNVAKEGAKRASNKEDFTRKDQVEAFIDEHS